MKYALLQWLACPSCGAPELRLRADRSEPVRVYRAQVPLGTPGYDDAASTLDDVIEGVLTCPGCAAEWPIVDGIPRMAAGDASVPRSAHVTSLFDASAPEWEEAFLDFANPLRPDDFVGRLALDVGCGFGRGAYFAAKYGAEVVAVDVDPDILAVCRDNCAVFPRVHCVQASATRLPFRPGAFDLVYAFGLMHHLADPNSAFHECSSRVRSGGRFSVWVYGPRQGAAAAIGAALRGVTRDMSSEDLLNFSRVLARLVRAGSHVPYRAFGGVPGLHSVVSHLPLHDHWRWPFEVVVADIYDRLKIPVTRTFTREELEMRFIDEGYLDVVTSRRIRNTESFRATGIHR